MKFIRIFDLWYVAPEDRGGLEADEQGMLTLEFEGIETGAVARVNGQLRRLSGTSVVLRAEEGAYSLTLLLSDGRMQVAEDLIVNRGRLIPSGFRRDELLLEIAERLQQLEAAEREDRSLLQRFDDKNKGKYFLGGTKQ